MSNDEPSENVRISRLPRRPARNVVTMTKNTPARRYGPLFLLALVALGVGGLISYASSTLRGVVLEVHENKVLLQPNDMAASWRCYENGKPGEVLEKPSWHFGFVPVKASEADAKALQLYQRYDESYEGTVMSLGRPKVPNAVSTAVIQEANGKEWEVLLFFANANKLSKGAILKKNRGEWDPTVLSQGGP